MDRAAQSETRGPGARGLGGPEVPALDGLLAMARVSRVRGSKRRSGTDGAGSGAKGTGGLVAARLLAWLLAAACLLMPVADRPAHAQEQQPRPSAAQDEFVPVDKLPTAESLPATPLVLIAYAVAWLAVLVYLVSIWKRMGHVDREIAEVARRIQQRSGG